MDAFAVLFLELVLSRYEKSSSSKTLLHRVGRAEEFHPCEMLYAVGS